MLILLILFPIAAAPNRGSVLTAVIAGGAATLAMAASHAKPWAVRLSWLAWIVVVVSFVLPGTQGDIETGASIIIGVLLISAPVVILRRIAKHETVTATTLWGAIAAYLSVGIAFSFVYAAVHGLDTDAFANVVGGLGDFNYFSFVTMTTLGYGDIAPVSDLARALAILQTVLGQIFLVVVVARVVTLIGTSRTLRTRGND